VLYTSTAYNVLVDVELYPVAAKLYPSSYFIDNTEDASEYVEDAMDAGVIGNDGDAPNVAEPTEKFALSNETV